MQLTKTSTILIIFGIHLLIGLLAYVFASKDSGSSKRASLNGEIVFLISSHHPAFVPIFNAIKKETKRYVISGSSIGELAENVAQFPSLGEARTIIILFEQNNDIVDETEALRLLASRLPASLPIIWFTASPVDARVDNTRNNLQIDAFNNQIKGICTVQENCSFIDLTSLLADENGNLKSEYQTGDGRSLNKRGAQIWVDAFKSLIP